MIVRDFANALNWKKFNPILHGLFGLRILYKKGVRGMSLLSHFKNEIRSNKVCRRVVVD